MWQKKRISEAIDCWVISQFITNVNWYILKYLAIMIIPYAENKYE